MVKFSIISMSLMFVNGISMPVQAAQSNVLIDQAAAKKVAIEHADQKNKVTIKQALTKGVSKKTDVKEEDVKIHETPKAEPAKDYQQSVINDPMLSKRARVNDALQRSAEKAPAAAIQEGIQSEAPGLKDKEGAAFQLETNNMMSKDLKKSELANDVKIKQ